jgi:2-polyprenyl-6-methoxyphenol hydroxylase-like FAD-dependent oxidoreductase
MSEGIGTSGISGLPVVVLGAGPVGLAAAARLAERGIEFVVLEAGVEAGAAVREWGHVRVFSPWRYDVDGAARRLLEAAGWDAPDPDALPTGHELVEQYLAPLAKLPAIGPYLRFGHRVTGISRAGVDRVRSRGREAAPFVIRALTAAGLVQVRARAVIDASGTWRTPNVLGADGLPAIGEAQARAASFVTSALPDVLGADRDRFAGRATLVVGAGHSASNSLLALAALAEQEPDTAVLWAIRGAGAQHTFGGEDADALPARGALGRRLRELVERGRIEVLRGFGVERLEAAGSRVVVASADGRGVTVDRVVSATGFRPDHAIASELRLDLDPVLEATRALAPLIDPNEHSCGTVPPHGEAELAHPEPGYYAVGMKSYGRAPTFLMATGYEQARSVVAALAGDWEAARQVHLDLPKTGVCSSDLAISDGRQEVEAGCGSSCGTPELAAAGRGSSAGIAGGLLSAPLALTDVSGGSGCCD